ncbi:MAG TPA: BamA/TamA family outer membrane protein [Alphaproteobacteria bacterium]|jgi:hypothetical protein
MPVTAVRIVSLSFISCLLAGTLASPPAALAQGAPAAAGTSATGLSFEPPSSGYPSAIDPTAAAPLPAVATDGSSEWVIAPIPNHSPSQGWALGLIGQYIFHPAGTDPAQPPSILGGGIFATQERSYGGALGYVGHLDEDRWRVLAGAGYGLINYDFFGIGNNAALQDHPLHIEQDMTGVLLQGLREVAPSLYLGPRLTYLNINAAAKAESAFTALPPLEAETQTVALGAKLQWDTRDNSFYPTSGNLANVTIDVFNGAYGSDFDYSAYEAEYNHYMSLSEKDVLALRGFGRYASGGAPFFDLSQFGQHNDLRGYESGKYRDRFMLAGQGELRHQLLDWLGVAGFAGIGEVAHDPASLTGDNLLWSFGGGLRLRIAHDNPVNFRVDVAQGEDGTVLYISVGEAF